MYSVPTSFSRSVVGKAKLLILVLLSGDALLNTIEEAASVEKRLTVWFPNAETQWPTEVNADGAAVRMEINPVDVANGEVKHARLKIDGVKCSRQAALDLLTDAVAEGAMAKEALYSSNYIGKNGRPYTYETGNMVTRFDVRLPETKFHTHSSLREDLEGEIRRLGLQPARVLKDHGYRG